MKKQAGDNICDSWIAQTGYETEYGHWLLIVASKLCKFCACVNLPESESQISLKERPSVE